MSAAANAAGAIAARKMNERAVDRHGIRERAPFDRGDLFASMQTRSRGGHVVLRSGLSDEQRAEAVRIVNLEYPSEGYGTHLARTSEGEPCIRWSQCE